MELYAPALVQGFRSYSGVRRQCRQAHLLPHRLQCRGPGPGSLLSRRRYGALGYSVTEYNQSNHSSTGYHALQLQGEKRYAKNFMLTGSFTWSRFYDFGVQTDMFPFNDKLDRAPADVDRALMVSVGHVWDLPFGPGQRFLSSPGPARFLGRVAIFGNQPLDVGCTVFPHAGQQRFAELRLLYFAPEPERCGDCRPIPLERCGSTRPCLACLGPTCLVTRDATFFAGRRSARSIYRCRNLSSSPRASGWS